MQKTETAAGRKINRLVLAAMLTAVGFVLPFFTGQIPQVGNLLLPMHIPVFLCAFICGWQYGLGVGAALPLLRSVILGMPMMYPNALAMAAELGVYGAVSGLIYGRCKKQNTAAVYGSMLAAMVLGRAAWGVSELLLLGLDSTAFTWQTFAAGAFFNAVPGIILQLILVPAVMAGLDRAGLVPYKNRGLGDVDV